MQHLQAIEGNPLDAEQIAMFEMFERERWSHDRCLAYVLERARRIAPTEMRALGRLTLLLADVD